MQIGLAGCPNLKTTKRLSQNLFRDEIEREARGQGGRRKRPGGVLVGTSRTFFADNAAPGLRSRSQ